MHYLHSYQSPLGPLTMASDGNALIGLWFEGQRYYAQHLQPHAQEAELPIFDQTSRWLDTYFRGERPAFTPPLKVTGSVFRRITCQALLEIPYGQTATYAQVALRVAALLGRPHMSAQATGGAIGHNPISIIIPCHRVIGSNGSLTGYAGGLHRKEALLRLEQQQQKIQQ